MRQAREREYPTHLKEQGTTGTAKIWFLLDDEGRVLSRVMSQSSGVDDFDVAALRVAQVHRFSPAMDRGEPVFVWIEIPIQFGPGE